MKIVYTLSTLLLSCINLSAVTIAMDEGGGTGHMFVTGTPSARVAGGSLIRWGYMEGAGAQGSSISSANFTQFATTTMTSVSASGAAATTFGYSRNDIVITGTLAAAAGKQVFMWVYDSTTASSSVSQALFTSVGWVVPATFATNAAATYNLTLGQPSTGTPAVPAVTAVAIPNVGLGTFAIAPVTVLTTTNNVGAVYTLGAAIPETSTTLLGALGALALLRRRRN